MFGDTACEFVTRKQVDENFDKDIQSLPYRFTDPHELDKKIDPRKLKFGSKIENGDNGERIELYNVKEILSPELIRLSNGLTVRLIGVTEESAHREEAMAFLNSKTKGQRIFLKFDKEKHDEDGNLLAYVYLKNKTFINAHLIKEGYVSVDTASGFKYKRKFTDLLHIER